VLERYSLPIVGYGVAETPEEALSFAEKAGYPVALKTASLEITHKTEAGGVRLSIKGPRQLRSAFKAMMKYFKKSGVDRVELMTQIMAPQGQEVFIGGKQDPEFGPIIIFGLGGIFVEVLKDVVMRVAPIDTTTAKEMIGQIRSAELLRGFRGRPACDIDELSRCIVNASRLIADHPEIRTLDINPLIVLERGKGCLVVDAKMDVA
jgi:succinyl-CoA synthetase beta subunit